MHFVLVPSRRVAYVRMHPIQMSLPNKALSRKRKKLVEGQAIATKSNSDKALRFSRIFEVFFGVCRRAFLGPSHNRYGQLRLRHKFT